MVPAIMSAAHNGNGALRPSIPPGYCSMMRVLRACDVPPPMIRRLARMMAEAKAATNVVTTAMSKFYHGDLGFRVITSYSIHYTKLYE